ncbi:D-glucuronyl C5-epimerase family protein [Boseaceae bacterium BT-24-1]|nr:D-glucuronyl C5-epimerase family protein [Boseaceae bacterium BT-24-1]
MIPIVRSLVVASALLATASGAFAQKQDVFEIGPVPLRSILYLSERGKPPAHPPTAQYWRDKPQWDEDHLAYRSGDKIYVNASNWGLTGLGSDDHAPYGSRRTSPGTFCKEQQDFTARQQRLADHVVAQARPLPNGSLTWLYDYEQNSNDQLLLPPMNSAFSQAVNLHFMLLAHCRTKQARYLETAKKAGDALITPVGQGGLLNDAAGETWFEEGPGAPGLMPYILNAHIYSLNVLFLLAEQSGDERYRQAAQRGAESLARMLYKFDTGYWTRYDLRPRYHTLNLEVHFDPKVRVEHIELRDRNGEGPQSRWSICERSCDLTSSAARSGNSFRFLASIETLRHYLPKAGDELEIEVKYTGVAAPRIYAPGYRPDIKELVRIPPTESSRGSVRALVGIREFGWHAPGDNYIDVHSVLLTDLYRWQGDPLFFASAIRFANYHRAWRYEKDKPVPAMTTRRFSPDTNEMANTSEDELIATCFRDLEPAAVDLNVAVARLSVCGVRIRAQVSILRRMGFRVSEDRAIVGDGAVTYSLPDLARIQ